MTDETIMLSAIRVCSKVFNTPISMIRSDRREAAFVRARVALAYVLHKNLKISQEKVGKFIGKEHSTISHYCDKLHIQFFSTRTFKESYQAKFFLLEEIIMDMYKGNDASLNDLVEKAEKVKAEMEEVIFTYKSLLDLKENIIKDEKVIQLELNLN